jgi:hypothetical protein
MCYDTVLWYDTIFTSLIINYNATSAFYMHIVHDTSYDSPIVISLKIAKRNFFSSSGISSGYIFAL